MNKLDFLNDDYQEKRTKAQKIDTYRSVIDGKT